MGKIWQFFDYFPDEGRCPFRDWYERQDSAVRARFDSTVDTLEITEDWQTPPLKFFGVFERKQEHAGLAQVKFYVEQHGKKTHYRAVGRWRMAAKEFIFLTGFRKDGRSPVPPDALDEAVRLLKELEDQRGEIHEHDMEETEG
jgi:hypothetical protein